MSQTHDATGLNREADATLRIRHKTPVSAEKSKNKGQNASVKRYRSQCGGWLLSKMNYSVHTKTLKVVHPSEHYKDAREHLRIPRGGQARYLGTQGGTGGCTGVGRVTGT